MAERRKSYVPTQGVEIYFEGVKSLWKLRTSLDVLIACHPKSLCLEIIAYHPEKCVVAPRLYVSSVLLSTKIDQNDLQQRVSEKKEALIRQKKPFNQAQISKEIYATAMCQYLLSRLQVKESEDFEITLSPMMGDIVSDDDMHTLDVICEKPTSLIPLEVNFAQKKIS